MDDAPAPLSENELNRCSGNTIGFQNEAAIGQYVEKKLNVLTSLLASNLEKQRTGTKIGWATWKADFAKTCNCDTFVKDNAKTRADYCE